MAPILAQASMAPAAALLHERRRRLHDLCGADDAELHSIITDVWSGRADRYSEIRSEATKRRPRIEMSYIGG